MDDWKLLPYLTSFVQEGGLEESHCQMLQDVFDSITAAASSPGESSTMQDNEYMNDRKKNLRSLPGAPNSDQGHSSPSHAGITRAHQPEEGQSSRLNAKPIQENGFKGILNIITEALQEPDLNNRFQQLLTGTARAFENFQGENFASREREHKSNLDQLRPHPIPTEPSLACAIQSQENNGNNPRNSQCEIRNQRKLHAEVFDEPVWLESTEDINAEFQRVKKRQEMKRKVEKKIFQDIGKENCVIGVESTMPMMQIGDTIREEMYVDALESSLDEKTSNESLYFTDACSDAETIIVQTPE